MAIYNYNFKPDPVFHFRTSEVKHATKHNYDLLDRVLTFGLELETDYVENGQDTSRYDYTEDLDTLGLPIYCKDDGSLNYGAEIVTHPCSLNYLKYDFRFRAVQKTARKHSFSGEVRTCGLHIHVGRRGLGDTDLDRRQTAAKLVLLADAVWDELVKFSRRDSYTISWARRPDIPAGTQALVTRALRAGGQGADHEARYTAVNLTNDNTVEFRVFQGTLDRDTILAAVELVDVMCRYAMTHTPAQCHHATWGKLMELNTDKELAEYCEKQGVA